MGYQVSLIILLRIDYILLSYPQILVVCHSKAFLFCFVLVLVTHMKSNLKSIVSLVVLYPGGFHLSTLPCWSSSFKL
jgi:hypothetical protein